MLFLALCSTQRARANGYHVLAWWVSRPFLKARSAAAAQDATIKGFLPSNEALQQPSDGQLLPLGALAQRGVPDVASSSADAHCSTVHALAMCRGFLCSSGGDAMIRVWDAATLRLHR